MRVASQVICLVLACIATAPALAQSAFRYDRDGVARRASPPSRASARAPRTCQAWCVADTVPCDPPEYKIADGRCQDPFFFQ